MTETDRNSQEQIPFSQELLRKATHTGALIIPAGYYLFGLSKTEMLSIMAPAALLMLIIDISRLRNWKFYNLGWIKFIGPMMRPHEQGGDFSGAVYILLSVCATVALFDKPIAIAALAFIIVGDTFAALIGRKFGKHKFGRKSFEGSFGCLLGTLIVALFSPDLPFKVLAAGAVIATLVEALSTNIDDNVSVPIVSGIAMTVLLKFLTEN